MATYPPAWPAISKLCGHALNLKVLLLHASASHAHANINAWGTSELEMHERADQERNERRVRTCLLAMHVGVHAHVRFAAEGRGLGRPDKWRAPRRRRRGGRTTPQQTLARTHACSHNDSSRV